MFTTIIHAERLCLHAVPMCGIRWTAISRRKQLDWRIVVVVCIQREFDIIPEYA